jgi:hypothetical protein
MGGRSRPARHFPELLCDDDPQCEVSMLAVQRVELPDEAAREAQRREIEEPVVRRGHLIRLDAIGMIREKLDMRRDKRRSVHSWSADLPLALGIAHVPAHP